MTKNISLPKLVKEAGKRLVYQISDDKLYLADKMGTFVVAIPFLGTDADKQDLEDLKTRCNGSLENRNDLAKAFDISFHENIDACVPADPTGICYTDETVKTVTWLTGGDHDEPRAVKVNKAKLDIFSDYRAFIGGPIDPIRLSSYTYQALVFPVRMIGGGELSKAETDLFHLHDIIGDVLRVR